MNESIRFDLQDEVAVIYLDDQKANALTPATLTDLTNALTRAQKEAKAVVLVGRPGRFSAGFDLKIMGSGADAATALVKTGCDFFMGLYGHPQPVVAACTGHAIAGGAALLLCSDHRVGTEGEFSIGFNEVKIGLPMPLFISELAQERLARNVLCSATLLARTFSPTEAVAAGFLDEITAPDELVATSIARAKDLARLPANAYASTKRSLRGPFISHIRASLDDDMERVVADGSF
ncbi:MAG: crotonase/enoyl-CoA hydratase family protein [Polyangiales bacterium]